MDGKFPDNSTHFANGSSTWPTGGLTSPYHSWSTAILPYLEGDNLHRQYDYTKDWWDSTGNNATVASFKNPMYICPSGPSGDRVMITTNAAGYTFNARPADYVVRQRKAVCSTTRLSNQAANWHRGVNCRPKHLAAGDTRMRRHHRRAFRIRSAS